MRYSDGGQYANTQQEMDSSDELLLIVQHMVSTNSQSMSPIALEIHQ
jgi:hypothetical protein